MGQPSATVSHVPLRYQLLCSRAWTGAHLVSHPIRCSSPASAEAGRKIYGPFPESQDAIFELSSSLKLRVRYRHNINLRQRMADESSDIVREGAKRIIAALSMRSVNF